MTTSMLGVALHLVKPGSLVVGWALKLCQNFIYPVMLGGIIFYGTNNVVFIKVHELLGNRENIFYNKNYWEP